MDEIQSLDLFLVLKVAVVAIAGLTVGFVGNMLGGGGGRPRLLVVYWAADSPLNAAGTNLLVGVLGGMIGTWMHLREGRIDFRLLLFMGIPSVIGAFIGGFFAGLAPTAFLMAVVGIITTWYGYLLLTGRRGTGGSEGSANPASQEGPSLAGKTVLLRPSVRRHLLEMSFGLAIGLFGGAVGLQGGQLRLTAVTGLLNTDIRMAVGTTRAIGTLTGLFGFLGHLLHLEIDWTVLLVMAPMAMLGAFLGAKQTGKVPLPTLRKWVGAVMIITSLPMFWLAYTQL